MSDTEAVILAGGKGQRMDVLCQLRPKPILPFGGRFRMIDFTLSNCLHSRIDGITVLLDYQRSHIMNYLRRWSLANYQPSSFQILEPRGTTFRGTADAVYQNLKALQPSKNVLLLAGDHVYRMDYRKMIAFHDAARADVTVAVINIPREETCRFGTVTPDDSGRIQRFQEKSPAADSTLASMGVCLFNRDTLVECLMDDAANPNSRHDFGYSILPELVKRRRVFAYRFDGYWQDIGTVAAYYDANLELLKKHPAFSLNGTAPVLTDGESLPAPRIFRKSSIHNSVISPGCVIKGYVENSVLYPGVWIEENAVVRNSVVMHNTFIGRQSIVNRSVIDEGVNIGDFCYVGFGLATADCQRDITIVGKDAKVPPHTAVGRNSRVMPHARPADFAGRAIPAGSVVLPSVDLAIPTAAS